MNHEKTSFITGMRFGAVIFNKSSGELSAIEAGSFENKGGWVVGQQFMDLMGYSYLMALHPQSGP